MENNIPPTPTPAPSRTRQYVYIALCIAATLAVIAGFTFLASHLGLVTGPLSETPQDTQLDTSTIFRDIEGKEIEPLMLETLTYPPIAFPSYLPTGDAIYDKDLHTVMLMDSDWSFVPSDTVQLPRKVTNPRYVLKHNGNGCYIALASTDFGDRNGAEYHQYTYALQFEGVHDLVHINRHVDGAHLPPGFEFSGSKYMDIPYMPYEIASGNVYPNELSEERDYVLFAPNGAVVSSECSEDFASMLRTVREYYEPLTLSSASTGVLWFQFNRISTDAAFHSSSIFPPSTKDHVYYRLFFADPANEIISRRPVRIMADLEGSPVPAVYDNKLWYVSYERGLIRADILSGEEAVIVPNTESATGPVRINDFYMYGDRLFYLRGTWCNDYLAKCNSELVEATLSGGNGTVLATNVQARDLDGFDTTQNKLYLSYREGDAGCSWGTYFSYNFASGTVETIAKVGSCADDGVDEMAAYPNLVAAQNRLAQHIVIATQLRIQNGVLSPVTTNGSSDIRFRFIKRP